MVVMTVRAVTVMLAVVIIDSGIDGAIAAFVQVLNANRRKKLSLS